MLAAFDTPFNALIKPGILTQIIIGIRIITDFGLGSFIWDGTRFLEISRPFSFYNKPYSHFYGTSSLRNIKHFLLDGPNIINVKCFF